LTTGYNIRVEIGQPEIRADAPEGTRMTDHCHLEGPSPEARPRYDAAVRAFNAGKYFEAHELFEELWREAIGPLKVFYLAMTQSAVALYHAERRNWHGATTLWRRANRRFAEYDGEFGRQGLARLRLSLDELARQWIQQAEMPTNESVGGGTNHRLGFWSD